MLKLNFNTELTLIIIAIIADIQQCRFNPAHFSFVLNGLDLGSPNSGKHKNKKVKSVNIIC